MNLLVLILALDQYLKLKVENLLLVNLKILFLIFFQKKEIEYEDIMVDADQEQLRIMMEKSKRQSVPQIFIGTQHIGGCDELFRLEEENKLEVLIY